MALPRFIASLLGALTLGCVINVGEDNCSTCDNAPRCHSDLDEATDTCRCDPGHQWANPGNENDFECRRIPPRPGSAQCVEDNSHVQGDSCYCDNGFNWCSKDRDDLTCCVDEEQTPEVGTDSDTDTDGTAGDESGGRIVELPECTAELEGQFGCTNPDPEMPQPTLQCVAGAWIELAEDEYCQQTEAGDFAYGCYLQDGVAQVLCGVGPGGTCSADEHSCIDATTLHVCMFGRLTARNCEAFCTDPERTNVFDHGSCAMNDCACCNEGDADCPA
jgi:hypothetical protein